MGAPKKPRKKSPKKPLKYPKKGHRKGKNSWMRNLMLTPEGRALRSHWSKQNKSGRPVGVPDGHTKETIIPVREKAKEEAKRIVNIMVKEHNLDDEKAIEALETCVQIIRQDTCQNRDKLTAARIVLEYTKAKPVAKSEVIIGQAESFLESVLDSEKD